MEMKATDFRIGNLVFYPVDGVLYPTTLDGKDLSIMESKQSYLEKVESL